MRSFNLRQVKLRSGEEYRDEIELELEPFELGGQRYLPVPEKVAADLAISKATTGSVFELAFKARLHGPCYRCLADAVLEIPIAAREYQATNPDGSDELQTPYVVNDQLDLGAWRATRWHSSSRTRSSAAATAPASAPCAGRT